MHVRTSLAVQWLRLHAASAGDAGLTPGKGTKISHAEWYGQGKKKKKSMHVDSITQCLAYNQCSVYLNLKLDDGHLAVPWSASPWESHYSTKFPVTENSTGRWYGPKSPHLSYSLLASSPFLFYFAEKLGFPLSFLVHPRLALRVLSTSKWPNQLVFFVCFFFFACF